jgi:hypothetical protein
MSARTGFLVLLLLWSCLVGGGLRAAPPVFNDVGGERLLNSCLFVEEGESVSFTLSAEDPDGDPLVFSVQEETLPSWGTFDPATATFSGVAETWPDDYEERKNMVGGIYDITFLVRDDEYTVAKVVTIYVLDLLWPEKTVAELVADRPVKPGAEIGTPVAVQVQEDTEVWSEFGGGKTIRRIQFAFTSQVPTIAGWEDDWVSTLNTAFLPLDQPPVDGVGAMVEGCYSRLFGVQQLAERACAELDIPVVIIDQGWDLGHPGELMTKYNDSAVEQRDPHRLFYVFAAAHYLRAADALATIIDERTSWPVTIPDFRVVLTGHSKLGHTCVAAGAAAPDRVLGMMTADIASLDTGAFRLLGNVQGAQSTKPDAFPNYLGAMMRRYVESLANTEEMSRATKIMLTLGTNDDKGVTEGYTPKYGLWVSEQQIALSHAVGSLPNVAHTTEHPRHSTYWIMWLAHVLLDRPITQFVDVAHEETTGGIEITAELDTTAEIQGVRVWATSQSDMDTGLWDQFTDYPMREESGQWRVVIPSDSTAYFVEASDEAAGVEGLISTATMPVNRDYPLLPLAPDPVSGFSGSAVGQEITLEWTKPTSSDFAGVIVRCSTDGYPQSPLEGDWVYDGGESTCTYTPQPRGTYYFAAFSYDESGNYSAPATTLVVLSSDVYVTLEMPSHHYVPGDPCWLQAYVTNTGGHSVGPVLFFVFVDDNTGDYWFWPSWAHYPPNIDWKEITVEPGTQTFEILPEFVWPSGAGSGSGFLFWGALTDLSMTTIIGDLDVWEFSFSEN